MEPKRKTILVADDNPALRDLCRLGLAQVGIDVVLATDGEEALRLAGERRPDGIVLDLLMPRLDGLSALLRLRADDATRHIPVILASGMPGGDVARLAEAYGAAAFLVKPFRVEELVKRVEALLAGAAHRAA